MATESRGDEQGREDLRVERKSRRVDESYTKRYINAENTYSEPRGVQVLKRRASNREASSETDENIHGEADSLDERSLVSEDISHECRTGMGIANERRGMRYKS